MVEVTKFNYEKLLEEVFDGIRNADFVAIDTNVETTGFLLFNEDINPKIIMDGWYRSIVKKQTVTSPLDFGIALFKKEVCEQSQKNESSTTDASGGSTMGARYSVRCYSIPILCAYVEEHDARSESRRLNHMEQRLEIGNIGMEFIRRTKLDLNKVMYGGTPFMNRQVQEEATSYMEKNPDFMMIDGKHLTNGVIDENYFPKLFNHLEKEDIEGIVSRLRGIAKFFDVIAETKKPIVGHNLLIKLIMLYKDFVEYLPQQFAQFMEKLETVLPQFYDTKYMASEIAQRPGLSGLKKSIVTSTDLFDLYRNTDWVGKTMLDFNLDKETDDLYGNDLEDLVSSKLELVPEGFCHESGFDACVSGMVFAKLTYLVKNEKTPFNLDDIFQQANIWKNKMFLEGEIEDEHNSNIYCKNIANLIIAKFSSV